MSWAKIFDDGKQTIYFVNNFIQPYLFSFFLRCLVLSTRFFVATFAHLSASFTRKQEEAAKNRRGCGVNVQIMSKNILAWGRCHSRALSLHPSHPPSSSASFSHFYVIMTHKLAILTNIILHIGIHITRAKMKKKKKKTRAVIQRGS